MGTRADFYVVDAGKMNWLGSIAWDGYCVDEDNESPIKNAKTPEEFALAVNDFSQTRDDWTSPNQGWPWPWNDSRTTDYAYVHENGKTKIYVFGRLLLDELDEDGCRKSEDEKSDTFPDMKERKNLTHGNRSGIILVSA